MTNKNLPHLSDEKGMETTNGTVDQKQPDTGSYRSVNQGETSGMHPEASAPRGNPTVKSEIGVLNPERDITTDSVGSDGQGREHDAARDGSTISAVERQLGTDGEHYEDVAHGDKRGLDKQRPTERS